MPENNDREASIAKNAELLKTYDRARLLSFINDAGVEVGSGAGGVDSLSDDELRELALNAIHNEDYK